MPVTGGHPDPGELGPELRRLAQAMLDGIDPAVRAAVALARANKSGGPGKCQQVWCPVCAVAALVSGEEHPLLSIAAEHSVALLAVLRAAVNDTAGPPVRTEPDGPAGPAADDPMGNHNATPTGGGYQPIPVTVEE